MTVLYVVVFQQDNGSWHVAAERGCVLAFQVEALAIECAHRLEERGIPALVLRRDLGQIADLLLEHGLNQQGLELVEAQTLSRDDAAAWSRELADRIADRIEAE